MEMKKWRCTICGEEFEGENPPEVCPVCNVGSEFFEEVKAEEKTTPSINRDEKKKVISGKQGNVQYVMKYFLMVKCLIPVLYVE